MNYFELLNSNVKPIIITERNEIKDIIRNANHMCTERTARDWLNYFSDLISVMASGNPYHYINICNNNLDIPDELWDICRKMAHFVLTENYFIISNMQIAPQNEMDHRKWDYEIPLLFMPILICFTKTIQKIKGKKKEQTGWKPVFAFFEYLDKSLAEYSSDDIFKKYSCKNKESLTGVYRDWINVYLGRNFFIHYEELLNEYAKSPRERKLLQDATVQLTAMAAPPIGLCKVPSEQDMEALDQHLVKYKEKLKNKLEKANQNNHNINPLYDQPPCILQSETTCINEAQEQFTQLLEKLSSKIERFVIQEHKPNSLYKIAVKNLNALELFENQIAIHIGDTKTKITEKIQNYYMSLLPSKTSKDICLQSLYDSKKLFFESKNNDYKIKKLSLIFQHSLDDIANSMEKFFADVRKASDGNCTGLAAKTTERRLKTIWIIDLINDVLKSTIEKIEKENLQENFPSLYQPPFIYQIGYPLGTEIILPSDSHSNSDTTEKNG